MCLKYKTVNTFFDFLIKIFRGILFLRISMNDKKQAINTKRLILRNLKEDDFNDMISIVKNPRVYATYMIPDLLTDEEEKIFYKKLMNICESNKQIAYGIEYNNKIIGFINSVFIEDENIEIGYFINPKYWNQGFATEALQAMIEELFTIGFKTVICGHFKENLASGRVMQKAGMLLIDKKDTVSYRGEEHVCVYYQINVR